MIGWQGVDKDFAVPPVEEARKKRPRPDSASFDRGCHGPENRAALDDMLECDPTPKKGKMNEAERERRSDPEFKMMARTRPRIGSNIAISSSGAWTGCCRTVPTASSAWSFCRFSP